jgi:hypothetical protein
MRRLAEHLPKSLRLTASDEFGIPAQYKKAVKFAVLAYATKRPGSERRFETTPCIPKLPVPVGKELLSARQNFAARFQAAAIGSVRQQRFDFLDGIQGPDLHQRLRWRFRCFQSPFFGGQNSFMVSGRETFMCRLFVCVLFRVRPREKAY